MKNIKLKLASNHAPMHFIAYSLSFMAYGCAITSLGPLVPYISTQTGNSQTQYALLFLCRSIGFMSGALILKILKSKLSFHKILLTSSIILSIFLILFCFVYDIILQGIIMFLVAASCCMIEITVNLCVLETQKNENIQFWMLLCHGQFSIGGLIGPILFYIFELYSFAIMGLMFLIVAPAYYYLKTPEINENVLDRVSHTSYFAQMKNSGHESSFFIIESHKKLKLISRQIQLLTSFMFLLCLALECSFGSWISSYSVLQGVTNKQEATKYSSIFWISITLSRFISILIPFQSIKKLVFLSYSFLICSLLTIALIFYSKLFALMFSAISFGICYSAMFPLLMSVPAEYNYKLSPQQGANFMLWAALGQGVVATLTGYLMTWFGNNMLFYSIFASGSIFLLSIHVLKWHYNKQLLQDDQTTEVQMNEIMATKD